MAADASRFRPPETCVHTMPDSPSNSVETQYRTDSIQSVGARDRVVRSSQRPSNSSPPHPVSTASPYPQLFSGA